MSERLIIGIGNEFRKDDGAGLMVARALGGVCHSGEGAGLMELWRGHDQVVVIDGAASGAPAGTLHRFDAHAGPLPINFFHYSTHRFSLAEAIEMSRVLGGLPKSLIVYGIEGEDFDYGEGMGEAVLATANQLIAELSQQ